MAQTQTATLEPETITHIVTRVAPRWKVVMWNDDVTTIEFVVDLLATLFRKPRTEARLLALEVHEQGSAIAVVTSLERGELYVEQVQSLARPRGFPLTVTLEVA